MKLSGLYILPLNCFQVGTVWENFHITYARYYDSIFSMLSSSVKLSGGQDGLLSAGYEDFSFKIQHIVSVLRRL